MVVDEEIHVVTGDDYDIRWENVEIGSHVESGGKREIYFVVSIRCLVQGGRRGTDL